MRTRLLRTVATTAVAALFLAAAPRASADTITPVTLTYQSNSGVHVNLNLAAPTGPAIGNVAGPYVWTVNSGPSNWNNPLSTFCIQLTEGIQAGAISYSAHTDLSAAPTIGTTAKANAIEALYGDYAAGGYSSTVFQLALWELVYDGTADIAHVLANPSYNTFFSDDSFTSSDANVASAKTLLSAALGNTSAGIANFNTYETAHGYELVALVSSTSQDQLALVPVPKFPVGGVPAPPAILLVGIGLLALGGRSRLKRLTPTAA